MTTVIEPEGLYCVLGDVRRRPDDIYGVPPEEIRRRFDAVGGWELVFAFETGIQRRWATTPAYFICVHRH